jgi:hypothetical protein
MVFPNSFLSRAVATLVLTGVASAASPSLQSIMPRGAQRGTDAEFTLAGERLADVVEVFLNRPGVEVRSLTPAEDGKSVKLTLALAADCPLGEHYVRLRARSGLSEVKTFWVGQFPTVTEAEPNTDFAAPQVVAFNSTVEGVADNEDVDYYAVELKKGMRLTAEVEGLRLNGNFWDPYVAILDAKRFELAAADDTALLAQDCFAQIVAPEDGRYVVQVRDSSYVGNGGCRYRLHIGGLPRPTAVYPAGGRAGSEVALTFLGDISGPLTRTVTLPAEENPKWGVFAEADGTSAASPNWLRVSPFDNVLEAEPNDEFVQATAAAGPLPLAFNGIIEKPGDVDRFRFEAKKDAKFTFIAHAKSIRSPLDPVMQIFKAKDQGHVASNDDAIGSDAKIDFTAPEDGEYVLVVFDHLRAGGDDYVYRIEASTPVPSLTLSIPQFARYDYQSRQMMPVPRGNRIAAIVNGNRVNFGGDLAFEAERLPPGVTLSSEVMPQSSGGGYPVVFTAAAEAPLGGTLADFGARPTDPNLKHIRGGFTQQLDLMMGEPNNTPYYSSVIHKLAVAVVEEVPFSLDVAAPVVPLVHNGTLDLRVVATRQEGFKAPITVRMLYLPPNVGAQPTITIPEGQNEAMYTLNANGNAEVRTWHLALIGESDAGKGPILAGTGLIPVRVAAPYLAMKIEMAAVEQGKAGEVLCKIEHQHPFEGKARVTLQGLPAKAEAPVLEITKDQTELHFPVTTTGETPVGQHKQLFASIEVPEAGSVIPHTVGHGGVLRVDAPPPAPAAPPAAEVAAVAPAAAPAAAPEAAAKPLSRLEKLRLEAKQALKK